MKASRIKTSGSIAAGWGHAFPDHRTASFSTRGLAALIGRYWLAVLVGIILGMGYLWLHSRVVEYGWRIKELERSAAGLRERTSALSVEKARLENPAAIKARMEEFGIELDVPRPDQVVRLTGGRSPGGVHLTGIR